MTKHQDLDARSLAMHKLVVEKIRRNPELIQHVAGNLARWKIIVCANSQPYVDAWQSLLDRGVEHCLRLAIEDSEHATAMRQSSPFGGVLTHAERWQFLREWKAEHEPY
jgi:hypothetical protein